MLKYNWQTIFKQCENLAHRCSTISDLAKLLDLPESTLRTAMNRENVTFVDFLTRGTIDSSIKLETLQLQIKAYKKEISYLTELLAKRRWLMDTIVEVATTIDSPTVVIPSVPSSETSPITAILPLSDIHRGQNTPEGELGILGEYNTEIADARLIYWYKTVCKLIQMQQSPIENIVLLGLGDLVENAHLRPGHEQFVDIGVIKQVLGIIPRLVEAILSFASISPKVTVVGVPGNHGRVTSDARLSDSTENFDYMIYKCLEYNLRDQSNISWIVPDSWYTLFRIYSYNIFAMHGEDIRSYVGFPWYGADRTIRKYVAMFRAVQKQNLKNPFNTVEQVLDEMIVPDYAYLAHFHSRTEWEAPDVECFVNGSFPGVSRYGIKQIKALSRPSQWLHFVHRKYGVTSRWPIYLDTITS